VLSVLVPVKENYIFHQFTEDSKKLTVIIMKILPRWSVRVMSMG